MHGLMREGWVSQPSTLPGTPRILREYFSYYHTCRTHLSLNKDPPETRAIESPELSTVVAFPRVGGLHHRYARIAA